MNAILTSNVRGAIVASVATVVAMFAAQANAETRAVPSATVRYGDLNLATMGGAHTLYRRIALAAEKVCPTYHTRDLNTAARGRSCQANAISRAVRAVNSPQLAAIYAERTGHG